MKPVSASREAQKCWWLKAREQKVRLSQLGPECCSRDLRKSTKIQGGYEKGRTKDSNLSCAASVEDSFLLGRPCFSLGFDVA